MNRTLKQFLGLILFLGATISYGQNEFITHWVTHDGSFTIPTNSAYTYDYTISWQSLSTPSFSGNEPDLTGNYTISSVPQGDTIEVKISGDFPHFFMNFSNPSAQELMRVEQWGTIEWKSFYLAFTSCENLVITATDVPDLSDVTDMEGMFAYSTNFNDNINHWDVSHVENMTAVFYDCKSFNQPLDGWDMRNVTIMEWTFEGATSFNQDLGAWKLNSLVDADGIFNNTGMTYCNMDNTLLGWSQNAEINSNVYLGTIPPYTSTGEVGINELSLVYNWNIQNHLISPEPFVFNVSENEVCEGEQVEFSVVNTGHLYKWSEDLEVNFYSSQNFIVYPTETKEYIITDGCLYSDTLTVVVNSSSSAIFVADTVVCSGESAVLEIQDAVSFTWLDEPSNTDSTRIVSPLETTSYIAIIEDMNGCERQDTVTIHVGNEKPLITASGPVLACAGVPFDLNVTGYSPFSIVISGEDMMDDVNWQFTDVDGNVLISGGPYDDADRYTYEVLSTNSPFTLYVSTIGQYNDNEIGYAIYCGETQLYSGNLNGGEDTTINNIEVCTNVNYTWSPGLGLSDSLTANPTAILSSNTSYVVTGRTVLGCAVTDTVTVLVDEVVVAVTADETVICEGNSVVLTASGSVTYEWNTNEVSTGIIVSPLETTTYTVTGTNVNGCTAKDSVEILVNALPVVVVSADATEVCEGSSVSLSVVGADTYLWSNNSALSTQSVSPQVTTFYSVTGTDVNGCIAADSIEIHVNALPAVVVSADVTEICEGGSVSLSVVSADTYLWSNNSTLSTQSVSPQITTFYSVTGTDVNGCIATDSVEILVNALPVVVITVDATEICEGGSVNLSVVGVDTYLWSNNSTLSTQSVSPEATTLYSVTGTDVNGCIAADSIEILVNALPAVVVSADATEICEGGSVNLSVTGADTYLWSNNSTLSTQSVSPQITTFYSVTGTDVNGCIAADSIEILVNALPAVVVSADVTEICEGGSVNLSVVGADTYLWSNNSTLSTQSVSPQATTLYSVTGTDVNGCIAADSIEILVNVLPVVVVSADATEICEGGSVNLSVVGADTYLWSNNSTLSTQSVSPQETTLYTVIGTDVNGCFGSDTITINVNACLGIEETTIEIARIYPNPATTNFIIEAVEVEFYQIKDLTGKIVGQGNIDSEQVVVDVTNLNSGFYLVNLVGNTTRTVKIEVRK